MKEFFIKHWQGGYSLPRSYWVNSVIIGNLLAVATAFVTAFLVGVLLAGRIPLEMLQNIGGVVGILGGIPVYAWSFVGTWRSASLRSAALKRAGWGTVAKCCIVYGTLNILAELVSAFLKVVS